MINDIPDYNTIYTKGYRLVAAVFVVTDRLHDAKDLRDRIRTLCLSLLTELVDIKDGGASSLYSIEKLILEIKALIDIAHLSNMLSKMNAGVLGAEFSSFLSVLGKYQLESGQVSRNSLDELFRLGTQKPLDTAYSRRIQGLATRTSLETKMLASPYPREVMNASQRQGRRQTRKEIILDTIRTGGLVGLAQILPIVPGSSEKTVQRDLTALLLEGKIKKEGLRRWCKYSIKMAEGQV